MTKVIEHFLARLSPLSPPPHPPPSPPPGILAVGPARS